MILTQIEFGKRIASGIYLKKVIIKGLRARLGPAFLFKGAIKKIIQIIDKIETMRLK